MEKLLSNQNKNKTNDGNYLIGQRKKIFSLALVAMQIFFANALRKSFLLNRIQDDLS
jgi:hypothetical protein